MKEKIKLMFAIGFIFVITGCASKTPMPVLEKEMSNANVTKEQVCKGAGFWIKSRSSLEGECSMFFNPNMKTIQDGIKFKKFESTCKEVGGFIFYERYDFECKVPVLDDIDRPRQGYSFFKNPDRFYNDVEPFIALKKAKAEAKSIGLAEENKKISENIKRDNEKKDRENHETEYEKKAQIKKGEQYICSDGYDKWILIFDVDKISFDEVNLFRKRFTYEYYKNEYDNNPIFIDRLEGTLIFGENLLKCIYR